MVIKNNINKWFLINKIVVIYKQLPQIQVLILKIFFDRRTQNEIQFSIQGMIIK